ncbi:MAG: GntR domain protein [Sporomusa sp.]|jgi:GntR family transcriptional repressor for pyruvate dehydrogenase complex|nr:GntR domain protein [Sporomusa sp.]
MKDFFAQQRMEIMDKSSDNLYMQIVEDIRNAIRKGQLQDGHLLPSERELAQFYDVSRVPVREALKVLEFLGVVRHIRGKGVFVKKIRMQQVLDHFDFMIMDPVHGLLDLFEAREAIELQAVRLAAQRRSAADMEAMEAAIVEMQLNIALGKEVDAASIKFHTAIVDATHNQVIQKINEYLSDMLSVSRQYSLKDRIRHEVALGYHRRIQEKIVAQDVDGAVEAMREHLEQARQVILKQVEQE